MALLHTLIRENKVQTISTPALLTRDNREATWSSGRRVPYLQSADITSLADNLTQPLFNYDFIDPPVGVTITLTPHIAKSQSGDNKKRTIGLDISQITLSNFVEFTDFNAPITEDSSISAFIDVEDGQQISGGWDDQGETPADRKQGTDSWGSSLYRWYLQEDGNRSRKL